MVACLSRRVEVGLDMQLPWADFEDSLGVVGATSQTLRTTRILWHDGDQFICDWHASGDDMETWLLDPVPDLAAAKAVVESWETLEGWEDDE